MDVLIRIKRLIIARKVVFTEKAKIEMIVDHLTRDLVYEAILNAPVITKKLRSRNPDSGAAEILYVIKGWTFDGIAIYTKGKILKEGSSEVFYVFISSKRAQD